MRYLVLVTDYPNLNGGLALAYIRTRVVYYQNNGVDIDVLNFSSDDNYVIDGVNVITKRWFDANCKRLKYDLLISHAPNLRNHYLFINEHERLFNKIVFFFHGHEVLKINEVYSKPYDFVKANSFGVFFQNMYDNFKFGVWRHFINHNSKKLYYVFVSNWMKNEFLKWVHPSYSLLEGRCYITYNCVGELFEKESYDSISSKEYDFVTIRASLDGSKYCVDIVNELAKNHPNNSFLLVGKGHFFDYYKKAENITWINERVNHKGIIDIINSAKCALMPTRTDAQGVMMCEMAAFGIPLITSDIPVCHEVFDGYNGVAYISNDFFLDISLNEVYRQILPYAKKFTRYYEADTCERELINLKKIAQS